MKFAPVLPPELYPLLDKGDYRLVQAHQVVDNRRMCEWFGHKTQTSGTVILDNGAFELGRVDVRKLFAAARAVRPTIIICPDKLQDSAVTFELALHWFDACLKYAQNVMLVPQGANEGEWILSFRRLTSRFQKHRERIVIGVPKILNKDNYGGRHRVIKWLARQRKWPLERIHLLGIWATTAEMLYLARDFPQIAGVDSTLPFATALGGWPLTPKSRKTGLDANDFKMTADIDYKLHAAATANIEKMRGWISSAGQIGRQK